MAWIVERKSGKYLIDRNPSYCEPLGHISDKQAERRQKEFEVDKNKNKNQEILHGKLIWPEYLRFVQYMERRPTEYSPKTVYEMKKHIEPFLSGIKRIKELTSDYVKGWYESLQTIKSKRGKPLAIDTIAIRLRSIQSFCSWLSDEERGNVLKLSPFKISIPAGRQDAGRALTDDQVQRILDCWPTEKSRGGNSGLQKLSKLFFELKFAGGFRLSELLGDPRWPERYPGAQHENLDRHNSILKVGPTKAGDFREVALHSSIVRLIPYGTGPIFAGKISQRVLRKHFAQARTTAKISGRVRLHDARVTSSTKWARLNPDPKLRMNQFGWKSVRMATHYNKVATNEQIEIAQKMVYDASKLAH